MYSMSRNERGNWNWNWNFKGSIQCNGWRDHFQFHLDIKSSFCSKSTFYNFVQFFCLFNLNKTTFQLVHLKAIVQHRTTSHCTALFLLQLCCITLARVMWAGIFFPSRGSLRSSPARQRRFSPLHKGKNPFCKGIPLTWHGPLHHEELIQYIAGGILRKFQSSLSIKEAPSRDRALFSLRSRVLMEP
jgi:hypothetical protein